MDITVDTTSIDGKFINVMNCEIKEQYHKSYLVLRHKVVT